jgi:hypothetical protein
MATFQFKFSDEVSSNSASARYQLSHIHEHFAPATSPLAHPMLSEANTLAFAGVLIKPFALMAMYSAN